MNLYFTLVLQDLICVVILLLLERLINDTFGLTLTLPCTFMIVYASCIFMSRGAGGRFHSRIANSVVCKTKGRLFSIKFYLNRIFVIVFVRQLIIYVFRSVKLCVFFNFYY